MWDLSKKKFAEVEEEAPAGAPVVETVGSLSDSEIESFLGEEDEETVSEPLSLEGEEQTKESMGTEVGVKAETVAQIPEKVSEPEGIEVAAEPILDAPIAPETKVVTPDIEELQKQRQTFEARLADSTYRLSAEEAETLQLNPEQILPKFAAKLHIEVLDSVVQTLMAQLPRVIDSVSARRVADRQVVDAFYGKWQALKGHETTVDRIASLYGQINPSVPREQAIEEIGLQAMMHLKLPIGARMEEEILPSTVPSAPPAPAMPGGSANSGSIKKTKPMTAFERFAQEIIDEE